MKIFSQLGMATIVALALLGVGAAEASVALSDNFNTENGGNYTLNDFSLTAWNVTSGSVDLIGVASPWNFFPANGLFLDMNGSTNHVGAIQSKTSFGAGDYNLSFDFAGSQRGLASQLSFALGDSAVTNVFAASNSPFTTISFNLTTTSDVSYLNFQSFNTGNANIGGLLDNVVLTRLDGPNQNEVPEPASLALLGAGLMGLGMMRRRKRT